MNGLNSEQSSGREGPRHSRRKRRALPSFLKLPLSFEIERLRGEYLQLQTQTSAADRDYGYQKLRAGYSRLNSLTDSFDFSRYYQIDLTTYQEPEASCQKVKPTDFRIRDQKKGRTVSSGEFNEKNYRRRNSLCSEFWAGILERFQSRVTRARFAVMAPRSEIAPHVDYDTDFSIRLHIPIFTDAKVRFYMKRVGSERVESFHMTADGSCYFLNQGMLHWVKNESDVERVHLVLSVDGQKDLGEAGSAPS